jgi:hypothetical protein
MAWSAQNPVDGGIEEFSRRWQVLDSDAATIVSALRLGCDVTILPVLGREPWSHIKAAA